MLGLCCSTGISLVAASTGLLLVGVHWFLTAVAFLAAEQRLQGTWASQLWHVGSEVAGPRLWSTGSIAMAHGWAY